MRRQYHQRFKLEGTTLRILRFLQGRPGTLPPSIAEIMNALDLKSTNTVEYHLRRLEDNDYITREYNSEGNAKSRSMRVTPKGGGWTKVPIKGTLDGSGIHLD